MTRTRRARVRLIRRGLVYSLGLAVLSLGTVSLAALFVEQQVEQEVRQIECELMRGLHALRRQVSALQDRLDRHNGATPPPQEPQ